MLSEKELQKISRGIIRKNLVVKEKDVTLISCGPKSLKFAEALALESAKVGAQPTINYGSDELSLKIYESTKIRHLKQWPKLADVLSKLVDVKIVIDDTNPFVARQIPQNKIEIRRKIVKPIMKREEERQMKKEMKAALIGFPTEEEAKAIGITFQKLEKIFWNAMKVDYEKLYEYNKNLIIRLKNANKIKIVGEMTDLEFSVRGRKFINACGLVSKKDEIGYLNLPDGEVFCPPIENSVNGEIYFDLPCMWHYGKRVEGVWLKFEKGRLVDFEIEKGKENFEDVFRHASGDKDKIGEFAIGTNPKARPTGGMIIIDEKCKSTIHCALGHNKHFGGKNDSTIHWDFFKDMRHGEIYVDGELLMKNGKIV
ncbi:MAG: aminopeptidase [Candidatus Aenigmatarchaeota archaeon]